MSVCPFVPAWAATAKFAALARLAGDIDISFSYSLSPLQNSSLCNSFYCYYCLGHYKNVYDDDDDDDRLLLGAQQQMRVVTCQHIVWEHRLVYLYAYVYILPQKTLEFTYTY